MHTLIALKIHRNPLLLRRAKATLMRWRTQGYLAERLQQWEQILYLDPNRVASLISEISERGVELRKGSPFAGFLTQRERSRIYAAFRINTPLTLRIRFAASKQLWATKRKSQKRDQKLIAA
jgi:hypothetical protein